MAYCTVPAYFVCKTMTNGHSYPLAPTSLQIAHQCLAFLGDRGKDMDRDRDRHRDRYTDRYTNTDMDTHAHTIRIRLRINIRVRVRARIRIRISIRIRIRIRIGVRIRVRVGLCDPETTALTASISNLNCDAVINRTLLYSIPQYGGLRRERADVRRLHRDKGGLTLTLILVFEAKSAEGFGDSLSPTHEAIALLHVRGHYKIAVIHVLRAIIVMC